jgi:hypothetical protein
MVPITNNKRLPMLLPEIFTRIFGFLDVKNLGIVANVCKLFAKLQQNNFVWSTLFPNVTEFRQDLPSLKERVRHSQVKTGTEQTNTLATVDFLNKSISGVSCGNSEATCFEAFNHPNIPNCSFVVYTHGNRQEKCALIKDKEGEVTLLTKLGFLDDLDANPLVLELREHIGKDTEFHEFKLIFNKNEPFKRCNDWAYEGIQVGTACLKGLYEFN